ncbi:uncharacterized protein LOC133906565 [Phragmites australis]|uniref:uncharacterized protein LOC133906565 n=1 Tax=Phragmites australis TaxID=29695 RepID=UPI002D77C8E7|nr:uncharacterized protein LOC133906565 [Phragmites australis]
MERKGGCCLAPRYGGAGARGQAGMAWQMGRIMLKFRPIAPKPAAVAPAPTQTPTPAAAAGAGRGKRKAVGRGGGRRGRKPKKAATVAPVTAAPAAVGQEVRDRKDSEKEKSLSSRSSSLSGITSVDSSPPPPTPQPQLPATLPLMPVSPVVKKVAAASEQQAPVVALAPVHTVGGQVVPSRAPHPAAALSWVTVEAVSSTWRDGEAPSAATAACAPCGGDDDALAFISDQWGRVTWMNAAFARAVSADDGDEAGAGLAGAFPAWGTCAGFTCRVRVIRHAGPRCGGSVVAPCDVWRLDAGGCYLWRLDMQAALTLGGFP